MSTELITRSPDLSRLRDEGYELSVIEATAFVSHVPYLDAEHHLKYGVLVSPLVLNGDITAYTNSSNGHVIDFAGEYPCNEDGTQITAIKNGNINVTVGGVVCRYRFSNKPTGGYKDYYQKFIRYIEIISAPAIALYPSESARTYKLLQSKLDTVFCYQDSNSDRAGIKSISEKLRGQRVAIIGLGGTGAYVLDYIAKTPVQEIHLIDGDQFMQHNAFRAPGAASLDIFEEKLTKVEYFARIYSNMRKNIYSHAFMITEETFGVLTDMDFVFLCVDSGESRRFITQRLIEAQVPFVDTGMGLTIVDNSIRGSVRTTAFFQEGAANEVSSVDYAEADDDPYATNIQIAELNALNAALAVIKWKKRCGFYLDQRDKAKDVFSIAGGGITHED